MDPGDLGPRLDAQLRVEVRQRLVHQEDRGLADDRPAERDALALAARQLTGLLVEVLEPEDPGGVTDALVDLRLRDLPELQPEGHVVAHAHVRIQGVALEDHRDVAILRRHVVDDAIADPERPVGDLLEPGDHPEAGCLAAARRSDEHHELAIGDLEVEIVDRGHVTVFLGDVVERNGRHRVPPPHRGIAGPCIQPPSGVVDGPRTRSRLGLPRW